MDVKFILATKLKGHTGTVNSVAFDPSGRYLASGSYDRTVRMWDVASGEEVAMLTNNDSAVNSVAFDPNGKYLASGSNDKNVRIWDVSTQQKVAVLQGHTGIVRSVAFDPSGKYLASGSEDRTVRIWDVSSMQQVAELKDDEPSASTSKESLGHSDDVNSVAFDPSGKYLASGSRDETVRMWDVSTWQEVAAMLRGKNFGHGHTGRVKSVAFHPSGKYLASGYGESLFGNTVRVWDVSSMQEVAELKGHTSEVRCIAFDPRGKYLASCCRDEVWIWNVVFPSAPALDELQADEAKASADAVRSKYLSKLGF